MQDGGESLNQELNGALYAEQVSAVGRISYGEMAVAEPKGIAQLSDGGIVTATVEEIQGGDVILRLDTGELLRAAAGGDIVLAKGDVIEAVVDRNTGATLLRILDLNTALGKQLPATSQQALSDMLTALRRNPDVNARAARFLAESGLPINADNLQTLTQITKGAGLGVLLGQVLNLLGEKAEGVTTLSALNPVAMSQEGVSVRMQEENAPQTAEDVQAPQAEGQNAQPEGAAARPGAEQMSAWTVLTVRSGSEGVPGWQAEETAGEAAPVLTEEGAAALPPEGAGSTQEGEKASFETGTAMREHGVFEPAAKESPPALAQGAAKGEPESAPQVLQSAAGQVEKAPAEQAKTAMRAPTEPEPAKPKQAESAKTQHAENAGTAAQKTSPDGAHPERLAGPVLGGDAEREPLQKLVEKLFVRPGEQSGEEIKKTVNETPQALRALKFALDQSDIRNKELCLKAIDQALRQVELSERNARFDYIQLPLSDNGEGKTAELFVFRRKKQKREGEAEQGTTILIALDTQNIGRVETLLTASVSRLSLEFRLEQPERAEEFRQKGAELEQALTDAGFSLTGIRFAALETRTTLLNAAEAAGEAASGNVRGVDIRI